MYSSWTGKQDCNLTFSSNQHSSIYSTILHFQYTIYSCVWNQFVFFENQPKLNLNCTTWSTISFRIKIHKRTCLFMGRKTAAVEKGRCSRSDMVKNNQDKGSNITLLYKGKGQKALLRKLHCKSFFFLFLLSA